jgi:hypothetical protein
LGAIWGGPMAEPERMAVLRGLLSGAARRADVREAAERFARARLSAEQVDRLLQEASSSD